MPKRKYRIWCVTEGKHVKAWGTGTAPTECPNDAGHTITSTKTSIDEVTIISTHEASTDPTADDDNDEGFVEGSKWVNTNTGAEFTCLDSTAGAAVWFEIARADHTHPGAVFGSEYQKAESLGESTTTSSTYQQKLRFTTSSVPAGDYYIGWSLTLGSSSTKKTSDFRVQVDDTTTLTEAGPDSSVTGWQVSQSGFGIVTLTAATHDIDIDFKSSDGVTTAEIKDVRVVLWRVS